MQSERPYEPDEAPEEIFELAEACRQYVLSALRVELDYTPETLSVLDHYLVQARETVRDRPDLRELLGRSAGAYFGEVVRRLLPSFWRLPSADAHDWQLCLSEVYLAFNPVGVVWDAVQETAEHGGPDAELVVDPSERALVEQRLQQMPEVSQEEFWLLTTRLEVIEAIAETLRLEMQRGGIADVEFAASDYEVEPRPLGQA